MSKGKYFSSAEDLLLTQLWKDNATDQDLLTAFPDRTLGSLHSRATLLKLGRRKGKQGAEISTTVLDRNDPGEAGWDHSIEVPLGDPLLVRLRANHTLAEATREFLG